MLRLNGLFSTTPPDRILLRANGAKQLEQSSTIRLRPHRGGIERGPQPVVKLRNVRHLHTHVYLQGTASLG
ncbi:hypothetical protein SBA5_120047 [Candidatus Sulfotelmatomonas gaucii]|uniref:Uncharacterized protein n=1 Tax=Candidatus Sulfuritelmatomonas gaucii TaxID=2043161 RepID=A0A2N9L425_9BACT|nr:hypothetical protein SBA5_120047 [Candidatus Sulfotelmatomonas gaucii]